MSENPLRWGLALEGGGAKGAYAFGVLQALAAGGMVFDAVSGTSIGALNAAFWASGKLEQGETLWRGISSRSTYPLRRPAPLFAMMSPILIAIQLVHGFFNFQLPEEMDKAGARALSAAGWAVSVAWLCIFAAAVFAGVITDVGIVEALLIGGILASCFHRSPVFRRQLVVDWISRSVVASCLLAAAVVTDRVLSMSSMAPTFLAAMGLFLTLFVSILGVAFLVILLIERLTVLVSKPLRRTVEQSLGTAPLQFPTYATVSVKRRVFDPDYYWKVRQLRRYYRLDIPVRYLPRYLLLNDLASQDRVGALLGSAALPFGIVPPVTVSGESVVDGGIVGNCPIYPLVSLADCTNILVVRLTPGPPSDFRRLWQESQRCVDLLALNDRLTTTDGLHSINEEALCRRHKNTPPRAVPYREVPEPWPTIHEIRPSRNLGNLLTGTLRFSKTYAGALLEQGRCDGKAFLAGLRKTSRV